MTAGPKERREVVRGGGIRKRKEERERECGTMVITVILLDVRTV